MHLPPDLPDIETREDIERLVRAFYGQLFDDPVLGPIFVEIMQVNLDHHIPTFTDFWDNILFRSGAYRGGFMAVHMRVHAKAHLTLPHVQRWLDYWESTVDSMFDGPHARLAKMHANRVGVNMIQRLQSLDHQISMMATDNPF